MNKVKTYQHNIAGLPLKVEIGALAKQASGSCVAQIGETTLMATAVMGESRADAGFFPLTCEFEERFYAAGKILGSRFVRREGRPSIEATLAGRAIDRTIRPLFPEGLTNEIQVINTCLSWDGINDPDVFGVFTASIALGISNIPWQGPAAAVRVAKVGDELVLNPSYEQRETSKAEIIFAGHRKISNEGPGKKGELVINMIDGKSNEISDEEMTSMYQFAQAPILDLITLQEKIIKDLGEEKMTGVMPVKDEEFEKKVKEMLKGNIEKALYIKDKKEYREAMDNLQEELKAKVVDEFGETRIGQALTILDRAVESIFKENVLQYDKRPDGRKLDEVRDLSADVAVIPHTHGSGVFQRGETQVLNILTLGSPGDHLLLEGMELSGKKRFMHHYNFPPYAVGEVKRLGSPGRREIGHGMLAEKALLPILPAFDDFPYTIRSVSEVIGSNGSSSMASVSASCLALMDAGVPITRAAAGIAVGLVRGKDESYKLLTDIQGPEDHSGEMDFKVAGTLQGITAIQMDVKGEGITESIFKEALIRAKKAREEILEVINKAIAGPRGEISKFAPKIYILKINPDKIGMVIGSGGKTINNIIDSCGGCGIDIEEDGKVFISSEDDLMAKKALEWVKGLTKEFEVGEIIQDAPVKTITDFGAFVEIAPGQDGLVHISEFSDQRIDRVSDVVKEGDKIPVKVIGVDPINGKISLSAKQAGFKAPKVASSNGGGFKSNFRDNDRNNRNDRRGGFRDRDNKKSKGGFLKRH